MKKLVLMILFMTIGITMVSAQNQARFRHCVQYNRKQRIDRKSGSSG